MLKESAVNIDEIGQKLGNFSKQLKINRLPEFLFPGHNFLGRYMIVDAVPYTFIIEKNLFANDSIFSSILKEEKTDSNV